MRPEDSYFESGRHYPTYDTDVENNWRQCGLTYKVSVQNNLKSIIYTSQTVKGSLCFYYLGHLQSVAPFGTFDVLLLGTVMGPSTPPQSVAVKWAP